MGFEPTIFGMKARRPRPLDDGAMIDLQDIISETRGILLKKTWLERSFFLTV